MVWIGCIEVGEPLRQKMIDHLANLLKVDGFVVSVQDRQPHKAKAQFFCGIRKKCHDAPPFLF